MAKTETLGIGDMRQNFEKLRTGTEKRTARKMVVAGGRILKQEAVSIARANGSVDSGDMVKNIAIKRESKAPKGTEQYHLGVRHGREQTKKVRAAGKTKLVVNGRGRIVKQRDNDPYYWRWVELGHKIVPRRRAGTSKSIRKRRAAASGTVDAKPFIQPALERKRAEAIDAMGKVAQQELLKGGG